MAGSKAKVEGGRIDTADVVADAPDLRALVKVEDGEAALLYRAVRRIHSHCGRNATSYTRVRERGVGLDEALSYARRQAAHS